jgi:hypothetical protein
LLPFLDHPAEDLVGPCAFAGVAAALSADEALGEGGGGAEKKKYECSEHGHSVPANARV